MALLHGCDAVLKNAAALDRIDRHSTVAKVPGCCENNCRFVECTNQLFCFAQIHSKPTPTILCYVFCSFVGNLNSSRSSILYFLIRSWHNDESTWCLGDYSVVRIRTTCRGNSNPAFASGMEQYPMYNELLVRGLFSSTLISTKRNRKRMSPFDRRQQTYVTFMYRSEIIVVRVK